jgi:hypothetical protein
MQDLYTADARTRKVDALRTKFRMVAEKGVGAALDAFDLDRFLARGPHKFYDRELDGPPSVESVEALVKLGCPRWLLTNKGTVNETLALLETRAKRGFCSVRTARYFARQGHPNPWSVCAEDVGRWMRDRRREGRKG